MSNIRITPINFYDQAILTESPALLTSAPATNAKLVSRSKTARSTSSAAQTIKGNWVGDARKINSFFMFRHNGQGGSIRFRLFPNSDWTGTAYDSGTVAIATAITSNSYDWGIAASAPDSVNDLLLAESPYSLFFSTFTAKSFQIDLSSCARSYWDICRIFLGNYLESTYPPKEGMTITEEYNDIQQRSKGGSLLTRAGEKWRTLKIDTFYLADADRALWRDLVSQIQLNADVAISVFPGEGGRQERDFVIDAQLQAPSAFAWFNASRNETTYTFSEV